MISINRKTHPFQYSADEIIRSRTHRMMYDFFEEILLETLKKVLKKPKYTYTIDCVHSWWKDQCSAWSIILNNEAVSFQKINVDFLMTMFYCKFDKTRFEYMHGNISSIVEYGRQFDFSNDIERFLDSVHMSIGQGSPLYNYTSFKTILEKDPDYLRIVRSILGNIRSVANLTVESSFDPNQTFLRILHLGVLLELQLQVGFGPCIIVSPYVLNKHEDGFICSEYLNKTLEVSVGATGDSIREMIVEFVHSSAEEALAMEKKFCFVS